MTMASIKLEVPKPVIAISHAGTTYALDADGTLAVPEEAAAALLPHGLKPKAPTPKRKARD